MLAQTIFAQRVCMGVDRYAFEVEGYCRVYCWWGVDFENIHLATLKLRSFESIWNLLFKNMLAQPIFAQRVYMGVDKYAFEIEGCSPLYCWWGVHFENIRLATHKLRSFASIWNLFFRNMLAQPIFAQRVCTGVDKYAFEVEGCSPVYLWIYIFGNSQIEVICVNLESVVYEYAGSANFCSKGVHGSGQICIWGCRLFSTVMLVRRTFWK